MVRMFRAPRAMISAMDQMRRLISGTDRPPASAAGA
ncbi:hypothetical protein SM0020_07777 [Sinorhizobium meliloti CCNWSX0020]|uniref:Uncharacterized protein n=1 Tax=Sinorhizobium meliloti CCNWSX0020 TaxID=1107881 RepID=H0FWJ1_RHIML|nr:hypothetical protein SM0020_07777 [Sinorhizobium meliloti CCNWSX0020]PII39651.1 hypothetical protein T190_02080 [Sinorhizobium meliloti CCBAU 01290]